MILFPSCSGIYANSSYKINNFSKICLKNELINQYGSYLSQDNKLELEIEKNNDILEFNVKNQKGQLLMKSPKDLTIYETWAIFLDDQKNIWLHSSDIGDIEWRYQNNTYVKKELVNLDEVSDPMPDAFRNLVQSE